MRSVVLDASNILHPILVHNLLIFFRHLTDIPDTAVKQVNFVPRNAITKVLLLLFRDVGGNITSPAQQEWRPCLLSPDAGAAAGSRPTRSALH